MPLVIVPDNSSSNGAPTAKTLSSGFGRETFTYKGFKLLLGILIRATSLDLFIPIISPITLSRSL